MIFHVLLIKAYKVVTYLIEDKVSYSDVSEDKAFGFSNTFETVFYKIALFHHSTESSFGVFLSSGIDLLQVFEGLQHGSEDFVSLNGVFHQDLLCFSLNKKIYTID